MKFQNYYLLFLFIFLFSGCFFKSTEKNVPTPQKKPKLQSKAPPPTVSEKKSPENPLLSIPEVKEWEKIWKQKNKLKALQKFQKNHGLFLPTTEKLKLSLENQPDKPCGPLYMSLVKNSKHLEHTIREVTPNGQVLNQWRSPSPMLIASESNSITVLGKMYESSLDFSFANLNQSPIHPVALKIDKNQQIHILNFNIEKTQNEQFKKVECPKSLNAKNAGTYYCLEKQSPKDKRLYALEYPCT